MFWILIIMNGFLFAEMVNLQYFKSKGARYTAADGKIEETARIQGDEEIKQELKSEIKRLEEMINKIVKK